MSALRTLFGGELPRLVMFDLDGTLMDSVPDLAAAVDQMLALRGKPAVGVERVRDWVGNGAAVLVRRALAGSLRHANVDDAEAEAALADFLRCYAGDHSRTSVYPGAAEFLSFLRGEGIKLALVTNKPERFLPDLLAEKGMADSFDWLVGGDTLPTQKPDPGALLWVMQQAEVSAAQALFVGDSRNDIRAARAAGVPVVAVSYGYNHGEPIAAENPDMLVDSLEALI